MILSLKKLLFFGLLLVGNLSPSLLAQTEDIDSWRWLEHADTLNKQRLRGSIALGTAIYSGVSFTLYQAWYKNFEPTKFQTFDDSREWLQMDKMGHLITTYSEARWLYDGARWTGLDKKRSLWLAGSIAMGLQGTIEIMDGFSEKWGFSWSDMAVNALGMATFVAQEVAWEEQRIIFKVSSNRDLPPPLPITSTDGSATTTLLDRNNTLYGTSFAERFLKDYNTLTIWTSVNLHSFAPKSKLPRWLNLAVGYGANNLYGGFANNWSDDAGNTYQLRPEAFPRRRQYYLSFDIDLKRIPTRRRWVRSALSILNFIKIPAPTLSYDKDQGLLVHGLYF